MRNATEVPEPPSTRTSHEVDEGASNDRETDVAKLTALEAELSLMKDRWMRSEAEMANLRMRAKRELEDVKNYAVQKFATDVVEAADNMRRGLDSIPPITDSEVPIITKLRDGFLGVEKSFLALLQRNGITKEDPIGAAFDPKRHEAMSEVASSTQSPGTVLQALSPAWTLNGRLLRPAIVIVAKASPSTFP